MSYTSNFVIKEMKGRTVTSNKQIFENKLDGFYASEDQNKRKIQTENKTRQDKNFKISSTQVVQNLFSF